MELHVRVLDGGLVSPQLACLEADAPLHLGAPRGALALDTTSNRPVIMAAASTGIAPLHAMLTQLAAAPAPPPVRLYYGALHRDGLYAPDTLEKLAAPAPWWPCPRSATPPTGRSTRPCPPACPAATPT
jgi:NAD(P)H-flavin reductase